jgi:hypothetical protein
MGNVIDNLNDLVICIAEVIDIIQQPANTYKYDSTEDTNNTTELFTITARIDGQVHQPIIHAKPIDANIKKIPLLGELILVCKQRSNIASSMSEKGKYNTQQWYYLSTINLNSSTNHNSVPGYVKAVSSETTDIKGKTFKESVVSPLQPFEGDLILEGRSGNSIRFTNTLNSQANPIYTIQQSELFSGDIAGSPIITISNGRVSKPNKQFVTEHIDNDNSSIWLTSDQRVDKLSLNFKNLIGAAPNFYNKSQIIGKADRIILSAKQDDIILDALKGIEINAPKIVIGASPNKEGMLHSTAVKKLLTKIIRTIRMGVLDASTGISALPLSKELDSADIDNLMNQLINPNILIDQYTD